MNTKLTLNIDKDIIEKAKAVAKSKNISLSGMIENYLKQMTVEGEKRQAVTPLVRSLTAIIDLPENFDHKKAYADRLAGKYK
jgi:hypothetical protein